MDRPFPVGQPRTDVGQLHFQQRRQHWRLGPRCGDSRSERLGRRRMFPLLDPASGSGQQGQSPEFAVEGVRRCSRLVQRVGQSALGKQGRGEQGEEVAGAVGGEFCGALCGGGKHAAVVVADRPLPHDLCPGLFPAACSGAGQELPARREIGRDATGEQGAPGLGGPWRIVVRQQQMGGWKGKQADRLRAADREMLEGSGHNNSFQAIQGRGGTVWLANG